ncbi:MAG: efflux RND transporter permease subunit [Bacteroidota bacterium]|nr:efflux RND transporter permease subunit [Bacteroidota bacterium]
MSFIEGVKHHQKSVLFVTALLVAAGVLLTRSMPVGLFPDITFPRIVILVDNGEEPADRVMADITKPIEAAISSVPGTRLVRSITSRGSAEINVFLDWGSNVTQTMELLQGQLGNIRTTLPATAIITVQQMNVSVYPIEGYSLTSANVSQVAMRDLALYTIRPVLLQVPGVARVEITGGEQREFSVTVDPARLAYYHLDIRQINDAIKKTNVVASTGLVENNYQLYLSLVDGLLKNTDDIGSVTVATLNGAPVHVSDLATVVPAVQESYIRTTAAGRDAVLINVMKQPAGSTVQIGLDVQARLASMKLPAGVHIENFYDQAGYIKNSIASTRDSIVIGIGLSMVVLLLFLRSWRIALVLALVVPATIACTIVCLDAVGQTINIMTLGGIAAAVGLIIDDSIVIIENIFTHFALEHPRGGRMVFLSAARTAIKEIMPAVFGSTASTIVINIPLAFLGGITGAFFQPLSLTMVFALLISFAFSLTLAPILASLFLRKQDVKREIEKERRPGRIFRSYESLMENLFRFRWVSIVVVLAIFAVTYLVYTQVGSSFMPEMDEGTFVLDYSSPPGTSLTETNRMLMNVERILLKTPEVESYSRRTGTQLGFFLTEPNTGDYMIKLKSARSRSTDDVINEVRSRLAMSEPALRIDFGQLLADVIGDLTNSPSPIEIKLFSDNFALRDSMAVQIEKAIENVKGVADPFNGIVISGSSIVFHVDPRKASYYGLTTTDVQDQLETMMEGTVESNVQLPEKVVGIRVRLPRSYKTDLDSISKITITGTNGLLVPIEAIASISRTVGQAELDREGFRSYVAVTARLENRDLGSTMADVKKKIAAIHLPQGVKLEYGGVYETQQESFQNLLIVALLALLLVSFVLLVEFREFSVPAAILIVTLLSLVGVMTALWVTGMTINISSLVGMIMIIGIVAENAIFILHYAKLPEMRAQGLRHSLIEAARHRARPIAMTTLAAILALLPLAIGYGQGAQMQHPLAIAVIGGFTVASIMLFFLLPMLYVLFHGEEDPIEPISPVS